MKTFKHYQKAAKVRSVSFINQFRGFKTNRKIVVIESDDWGSIRMPSLEILNNLLRKGVKLRPEMGYDKYDTLASNQDLEMLMEVLSSVCDINGSPAKITLNYIMGNPDFDKIKESGFTEYHYELFTETLKRYPNHDKSFDLVKEGTKQKMFQPQFHGREHLNVLMWLDALRNDYTGVRESFNYKVFSNLIRPTTLDKRYRFLEAYNINVKEEYKFIQTSIQEGLKLFEDIFEFKSESIIAPTYLWDPVIEETAFDEGVRIIQGGILQKYSEYYKNITGKQGQFHYLGEKNRNNQVYLIRNGFFEPSQNSKLGYDRCLNDIEIAFKLKKPAIISSHRLNFIGELSKRNRDENLNQFRKLLNKIIVKYPDVQFMSSDELGNLIMNE